MSLREIIADITGIRLGVLTGSEPAWFCPVAGRMSWASESATGREEDIAYCLLGLRRHNSAGIWRRVASIRALLRTDPDAGQ
jgi:hypothetical protein